MSRNVLNVVERSTKGRRSQANAGKHETYKGLTEESTESLVHEIVAIERSASTDPRLGRPWGPGYARSIKDLLQTKDLDVGVGHGDHTQDLRHQ